MRFRFLLVFTLFLFFFWIEAKEDLDAICQWEEIEAQESVLSEEDYKVLLEKCQDYYEEKSAEIGKDLTKTQQEKDTLQNKIYSLNKKIQNLDYQISQGKLKVKDLSYQIEDTEQSIVRTFSKIEDSERKLANILKTIYQEDQKSLLEILLGEVDLSSFFDNLIALEMLNVKNQELLASIKGLKVSLEYEKGSLGEEKQQMENLVYIQNIQKQENATTKQTQEYYLKITEKEYQKHLQEKEAIEEQVAKIRNRLFELIGVAEGGIEFGKAVEIAKYVEGVTGVRAAFLLSIIAQESMKQGKFGGNVGQCYVKDTSTGNGIYITSGKSIIRVMNPTRDVPVFLKIINELNTEKGLMRDPFETPVSCWIEVYSRGLPFGWGGAMGPAQFIPSTWSLYKDSVKKSIGRLPDPWDIRDSFLVSGTFLKDLGAVNNEWRAAMRYFSGSSWSAWEEYYGNSVISRAANYQKEIDLLETN